MDNDNGKILIWKKDMKNICSIVTLKREGTYINLNQTYSYKIDDNILTIECKTVDNSFNSAFAKIAKDYTYEKKFRIDDINFLESKLKTLRNKLETTEIEDEEEIKNDIWLYLMKIANHKKEINKDILFNCDVIDTKYIIKLTIGQTKCIHDINFSWITKCISPAEEDIKHTKIKFKIPSFNRKFKVEGSLRKNKMKKYIYYYNILKAVYHEMPYGIEIGKLINDNNICLKNLGYGILTE